jgi:hypothetical protein
LRLGIKLFKNWESNNLILLSIFLGLIPIVLAFIFQAFHFVNIISIIIVMTFWFICASFMIVPTNIEATHLFEDSKSVASAVLIGSTFIAVGIFSYIEAELNPHKLWQIGVFLSACWLISFFVFYFIIYKKSINQN